jgi:hypothetical protein
MKELLVCVGQTRHPSIVAALIHYDQRIRREGYDVEWMMRAAGFDAPATSVDGGSSFAPAATEGPLA